MSKILEEEKVPGVNNAISSVILLILEGREGECLGGGAFDLLVEGLAWTGVALVDKCFFLSLL